MLTVTKGDKTPTLTGLLDKTTPEGLKFQKNKMIQIFSNCLVFYIERNSNSRCGNYSSLLNFAQTKVRQSHFSSKAVVIVKCFGRTKIKDLLSIYSVFMPV